MNIIFVFIFFLFSTESFATCNTLFLKKELLSSQEIELILEKIKQAKKNRKEVSRIKNDEDLKEEEIFFLENRFPYTLKVISAKKKLAFMKRVLANREQGIIERQKNILEKDRALRIFTNLSAKNQNKVSSLFQGDMKRKKLLKKLESITSSKKAKTLMKAVKEKKICCRKTCKSCPINYPFLKKEKKLKLKINEVEFGIGIREDK